MGRVLLFIGVFFVLAGLVWEFGGRLGLGNLPGDIVIDRGQTRIHFPVVTCLVVSVCATLVMWFVQYLRR